MIDVMQELIPGLPEDLALECLTQLHYSTYPVASQVSKRWCQILRSRDFYYHRKKTGYTHKAACLIQSLPIQTGTSPVKDVRSPKYGVSIYDMTDGIWDRVDAVPGYPDGLPLFCQITSSDGKLVLMGGWDSVSYQPQSHVFVYEFTTREWRRVKDMPETRSFFALGVLNGKVIVAGGHDENKNALNSAWLYDVTQDEWTELPRMSQERDECEGIVVDSEFWVVSGYKTDSQGSFEGSADVFDLRANQWRRVEDAWTANRCPRSCIGRGKHRKLISWAESSSDVKVGTCGVEIGEWTFVSGSAYQGGTQVFFVVGGQNGKWDKLSVASEFSGFVQSGCAVEI